MSQSNVHRAVLTCCNKPHAGLRANTLGELIPLWPAELADTTKDGHLKVLAKLRRALREERRRGIAGHWSYNLARHKALLEAYRKEVQCVRRAFKETRKSPSGATHTRK